MSYPFVKTISRIIIAAFRVFGVRSQCMSMCVPPPSLGRSVAERWSPALQKLLSTTVHDRRRTSSGGMSVSIGISRLAARGLYCLRRRRFQSKSAFATRKPADRNGSAGSPSAFVAAARMKDPV